jgi:hypothetical protein
MAWLAPFRRLLGLGPSTRCDAGLDIVDPVFVASGHGDPVAAHRCYKIWRVEKVPQVGISHARLKKLAAAPLGATAIRYLN